MIEKNDGRRLLDATTAFATAALILISTLVCYATHIGVEIDVGAEA